MKITSLALLTILFSSMFLIGTTTSISTKGVSDYNPWCDFDDDGDIDIYDIVNIADRYGTTGTPVNKTALLYNVSDTFDELLFLIEYLNATVIHLEGQLATLETDVGLLRTEIAQMNATITRLEAELAIMNTTKLGKPDYDSGWFNLSSGSDAIKTHGLNTKDVLVYMVGKYSDFTSPYIHQIEYGGEFAWPSTEVGVWWLELTETTIRVHRRNDDSNWNQVRIIIWKIPQP